VGKPGCGKSRLNHRLAKAPWDRSYYAVILNVKREFSDFVEPGARYMIADPVVLDDAALYQLILKKRRVFFQLACADPRPFIDTLGRVLMRLRYVLVLVDEAHEVLESGRVARGIMTAYKGGRELGHNWLIITQNVVAGRGGLDLSFQNNLTHFITFRITGDTEIPRIERLFPDLGRKVSTLAKFDPSSDPQPSEFAVLDMERSRAQVMKRSRGNRLKAYWMKM